MLEYKKKSDKMGETYYMSGCNGMLPTMFDVQPVSKKIRYTRVNYQWNYVKRYWNMLHMKVK